MKVILAGYNVDVEILKRLKSDNRNVVLTPETISAAYARISRSEKSATQLREEARSEVEKARISNRKITFEMGHHSIAEHAVFNFDIIGISRLAVEELESHRLCSYTEKSQRYVRFKGDFFIPQEIKGGLLDEYQKIIKLQNQTCQMMFERLREVGLKKYPKLGNTSAGVRALENRAKEDARYILSLATKTQLGSTINARNLELMIRRFASHRLKEVNQLGKGLFKAASKIAPSLILFFSANDYDRFTYQELKDYCNRIAGDGKETANVGLVDYTADGDEKILSALLFKVKNLPFEKCQEIVRRMKRQEKIELFKNSCRHLELYDAVLREFEFAYLTYSLVVSASCFAQLKRHRIATITTQGYEPSLGNTIPESIKEIGGGKKFFEIIKRTNDLYERIEKKYPGLGAYILTNSHRKRVLVNLNLRELYHISRLREDPTTQWDIKEKVKRMSELAREIMPITTSLLGGKSDYPLVYYTLFGKRPKVTEVPPPP